MKSYTSIPLALVRRGIPVILGDGRGLLDAVYVDDVATALVRAAQSPRASGQAFNIGHETVTFERFYGHYSRMLNRPARHLPLSLLTAVLGCLDLVPGARGGTLQDSRRGAAFLIWAARNARHFPSSKATALLGYSPKVRLPAGMLKVELWARRQGLVGRTGHALDDYGPLPFRPLALVHPESEEDIVQIVQTALRGHHRVKAIGSLHSLCPIPETDGICVVLDRYDKLLGVDGALVTVQAGMKLRDLNDALAELNLALPVNGSIAEQTVAGAISTATHGGSIHHGSLSDYVEAVRMVRADGSVRDIDRSQDLFPGVIVSLGLLGIMSTVTFRCVPSFALRSRTCVRKAPEVLDDFDRIHRASLYVDMLYYPVTDDIEILTIDRMEQPLDDASRGEKRPPARSPAGLAARLGLLVLKSGARLLTRFRLNSIQRHLTRRAVGSYYRARVGRSDRVLVFADGGASGRSPLTIQDMEVAVPFEQAREAIGLLRDHFSATRRYPLFPCHIRASARSNLWLSPAHDRDVCWLELWQYPRTAGGFRHVHDLLERLDYRFHWGKEAPGDPEYIRRQYPRWDDFCRLREEWDPGGLFLNGYLEPFFTAPR